MPEKTPPGLPRPPPLNWTAPTPAPRALTLREAVVIAEDYQLYRRGLPPYDYGQDGCMSPAYLPEAYGRALDVLLEHARHHLTPKNGK